MLASYLERDPLMWMMLLHLHVNQKSDYDDDMNSGVWTSYLLVLVHNKVQKDLCPQRK